jgi:hypothetical protein
VDGWECDGGSAGVDGWWGVARWDGSGGAVDGWGVTRCGGDGGGDGSASVDDDEFDDGANDEEQSDSHHALEYVHDRITSPSSSVMLNSA